MGSRAKRIKVPISDELRETVRRWNDFLDEVPFESGRLSISERNLPVFQAALQKAGLSSDDRDRLQCLLLRFEKSPGEKDLNIAHFGIAFRVSELLGTKKKDGAYQAVADEVGLDKSTVGRIYRKFSRQ